MTKSTSARPSMPEGQVSTVKMEGSCDVQEAGRLVDRAA